MHIIVLLIILLIANVKPSHADQSYGRFGRFHEDGLLTTNLHPRGFTVLGTNPELSVGWGDPKASLSAITASINPTEKRLTINGGGIGAPTQIRYTLLYPGFSATFGKQMVLRFKNRANKSVRVGLDPTRLRQGWLLIIPEDTYPAIPLLIRVPKSSTTKAWFTGDGLTVESEAPLGEVVFTTPTGSRFVPSLDAAWKAVVDWGDAPIPSVVSTKVTTTDTATTLTTMFDTPYAPVSPLLALALDSGWAGSIKGPLVRTNIRTRYGPFVYVASTASVVSGMNSRAVLVDVTTKVVLPALPAAGKRSTVVRALDELWELREHLSKMERLATDQRSRLVVRYRVLRDAITVVKVTEPITNVSRTVPNTGRISGKRAVDDVIDLAKIVLLDAQFVDQTGDLAARKGLNQGAERLLHAVDSCTDWLWGCVTRADDGFQSVSAADALIVAAALDRVARDLKTGLRQTDRENAAWLALMHTWSYGSRLPFTTFARRVSMIKPSVIVDRFDELTTGSLSSDSESLSSIVEMPSYVPFQNAFKSETQQRSAWLQGNTHLSKDELIIVQQAERAAAVPLMVLQDVDEMQVRHVVPKGLDRTQITVSTTSYRPHVLRLKLSDGAMITQVHAGKTPLYGVQSQLDVVLYIPPSTGNLVLDVYVDASFLSNKRFLLPLFGMILTWPLDIKNQR